jgi:N-acetyl-gamma-glutamyl-phosphate reductase
MHKIPVGVLGASGYAGRELCALVAAHPHLTLAFATADRRRGERVRVGPPYAAPVDVEFQSADEVALGDAAVVFTALPHGASAEWTLRAREAGARVVDLSSDLRPGHLGEAVQRRLGPCPVPYGLPELFRDQVRPAPVVANPGCYPTAVLVALAPLARAGLLAPGALVSVSAASGVTGRGNSPRADLLFGEVADDFRAYGDAGGRANAHRHLPEMRAGLAALGADVDLVFTPHLLPAARGILATITVPLAAELDGRPGGAVARRVRGRAVRRGGRPVGADRCRRWRPCATATWCAWPRCRWPACAARRCSSPPRSTTS